MFYASYRNRFLGHADYTFFSTIHQKIGYAINIMRIFDMLLINYTTLFHLSY